MLTINQIRNMANSSLEYMAERSEKDGHLILVVREYFDPDIEIRIDLSKLTPEIIKMVEPDDEDGEDENPVE